MSAILRPRRRKIWDWGRTGRVHEPLEPTTNLSDNVAVMCCAITRLLLIAVVGVSAVVCVAQSTPAELQSPPAASQATSSGVPSALPQDKSAPGGTQAPAKPAQPTEAAAQPAPAQPAAQPTPAPAPAVQPAPVAVQSAPTEAEKNAAIEKFANRFIERLHQTLDVGALNDMFVSDVAARYREYPGEFLPFSTPRMAKTLLKQSDDTSLRRKLMADWNLAYLISALLKAASANADPAKVLPPEFVKFARKSNYLKPMIGVGGQVTLVSAAELNDYLSEADQMVPILRRSVKPETLATAFRPVAQEKRAPTMLPYGMGYDVIYTIPRESLLLVVVDNGGGEYRVVSLAAPSGS